MTAASRKFSWPGLVLAALLAVPAGVVATLPAQAQPAAPARVPAKPLPERAGTDAATIE